MKAMILAAGLGTRLRPLTDSRPKALVELNGRTLLEITISRLRSFGVTEIIINVHHFADQVVDFLRSRNNFGLRIEISREDDLLLDTGGGLKKASWFFLEGSARPGSSQMDEPFLLHNVDVISNIDLHRMLQFHKEHRALATLAVRARETSRPLLFDSQLQLRGRRIIKGESVTEEIAEGKSVISSEARNLSSPSGESNPSFPSNSPLATRHSPLLHPLAFCGIHVLSPRLLPLLTEDGAFSIVPTYLRLSAQGQKILGFRTDQYYWRDLGRPSDLAQAALDLPEIG
jgi:NDP-sugar pyrophosphorylase family protein